MKLERILIKNKVKELRISGHSYLEISELTIIPRSTVVGWCQGLELSVEGRDRLKKVIDKQRKRAQECSIQSNRKKKINAKRMISLLQD